MNLKCPMCGNSEILAMDSDTLRCADCGYENTEEFFINEKKLNSPRL